MCERACKKDCVQYVCVCVLWGRETFWTGIVGSIMSVYSVSWDSTCKECSHLLVHQSSLRAGDCRACKSGVISTPSASSAPRILPDFKIVYSLSYFPFSKYAHAYLFREFCLFKIGYEWRFVGDKVCRCLLTLMVPWRTLPLHKWFIAEKCSLNIKMFFTLQK